MEQQKSRCSWCKSDVLYQQYHDNEWGIPVRDDAILFEFLILETFQAGLSWITILRKRENFRLAFDRFNYHKIALYDHNKIHSLLQDTGIIRNKLKVHAAIVNAQQFITIQKELGSFNSYIWSFIDDKPIVNRPKSLVNVPSTTIISDIISKDLKKRGFKFVGSTTVYAFMQAVGMVDDHVADCWLAPK